VHADGFDGLQGGQRPVVTITGVIPVRKYSITKKNASLLPAHENQDDHLFLFLGLKLMSFRSSVYFSTMPVRSK
jgi:hypothetical protein